MTKKNPDNTSLVFQFLLVSANKLQYPFINQWRNAYFYLATPVASLLRLGPWTYVSKVLKGEMYEADRVTREKMKNLMLVVWATALQKMFNAYSNQSHHQKALVDMWIALIISPPFIFLLIVHELNYELNCESDLILLCSLIQHFR